MQIPPTWVKKVFVSVYGILLAVFLWCVFDNAWRRSVLNQMSLCYIKLNIYQYSVLNFSLTSSFFFERCLLFICLITVRSTTDTCPETTPSSSDSQNFSSISCKEKFKFSRPTQSWSLQCWRRKHLQDATEGRRRVTKACLRWALNKP